MQDMKAMKSGYVSLAIQTMISGVIMIR